MLFKSSFHSFCKYEELKLFLNINDYNHNTRDIINKLIKIKDKINEDEINAFNPINISKNGFLFIKVSYFNVMGLEVLKEVLKNDLIEVDVKLTLTESKDNTKSYYNFLLKDMKIIKSFKDIKREIEGREDNNNNTDLKKIEFDNFDDFLKDK